MKLLVFSAAFSICIPILAQDQPIHAIASDHTFTMFRTGAGFRINAFHDQLTVTFRTLDGDCKTATGVLRLQGDVEVITDGVVLQADKAEYRCDTGEIGNISGNVHFKYTGQSR